MPTYQTYVAGVSFRREAAKGCYQGQQLTLVRSPNNPHDKNAIRVMAGSDHIGFIPGEEAENLAPLMDSGNYHVQACIDGFFGGGGIHLRITYERWQTDF